MRKMIFTFSIVIVLVLLIDVDCISKQINENAGTRSGQVLNIGIGANAVGMGESYVAVADNVYATYWNPAGLSIIDRNQIGLMHNEWFEDIRHEFLGLVFPVGDVGTFAGSVSYISMGELERTNEYGDIEGKFRPYDLIVGLSFGSKLNSSISAGISAKVLQEKIDEEKAQVLALDVGLLYRLSKGRALLGIGLRNLGTKMKFIEESFSLPMSLNIGAGYRLIDNALTVATDLELPSDNDPNVGLGFEYKIVSILNLRAGYRYTFGGNDLGVVSGLRTGIGIEFGRYKFDYAFVPYGDLGQAHRISMIASF